MSPLHAPSSRALLALVAPLVMAAIAAAQDVVTTVVSNANAVAGSAAIASFGYNPTGTNGGTIYSAGFGAGAEIRQIANVDGSQQVTQLAALSDWTLFMKGGNPNNGGGQPTPGGFLLNTAGLGAASAYTKIIVTDGGGAVTVSGTRRNDLTQRVYSYDVTSGSFSSIATQAAFATAAGLSNPVGTTTSSNLGRQFAFSGDGQSAYVADSTGAAAFGGIYRVNLVSGTVTRLLADTDTNTEPAVLSSGGVDTILIRGGASTNNIGGIDRITFDGSTATPRAVHLSAASLADFLESSGTSITTLSMAADAAGNVYLNNTTSSPDRRGIFQLDPQGRLSKVVSQAERKATLITGSQNPNANTLRIQPRTVTHPNGFPVTQLLYTESAPLNLIAGAYVFKTGDFDRDNDVDTADLTLFRDAVTVRNGPAVGAGSFKFDLNGNDRVDWKDVQVLGKYLDYQAEVVLVSRLVPPQTIMADADLNGLVDFADFRILRTAYSGTSKSYVQGDFDGDNQVTLGDLQVWVNTSGFRSSVVGGSVVGTPFDQGEWTTFLSSLTAPAVTLDVTSGRKTQFELGYRSVVIASSLTKTGSGTLVLDGPNSHTGVTTVATGTLELANAAALATSTLRPLAGASVTLASGVSPTIAGLDLTAGGRFEIGTGRVTVASGTVSAITAGIIAGRGDGLWSGTFGITSSAAFAAVAGGTSRAIGWLDNGDGSVTFAFAAPGDLNIDGQVDILDAVGFLAAGRFDSGLPSIWSEGDSNYDGAVDILDIGEFLGAGLYDGGAYVGSGSAPAIAPVPEPALGVAAVGAAGLVALLRRRRGRDARRPLGSLVLTAMAVMTVASAAAAQDSEPEPPAAQPAATARSIPQGRAMRLSARPTLTEEQRKEWIARLRELYSQAPEVWPQAIVDSSVNPVELGPLPDVSHPADNPISKEKAELGRLLFFDARLSGSGQIACASCHDPELAWGDGRSTSFGHGRRPLRRSAPPLLNVGLAAPLFWDGRAATLEEQAVAVLTNPAEMRGEPADIEQTLAKVPEYRERFRDVFGDDEITFHEVAQALAAFQRTIVGGRSLFDAFLKGQQDALSDSALVGLHLFRTEAGCMNCHHGPTFSDGKFHDLGLSYYGRKLEDLGRYHVSEEAGDVGRFRTPTLRNVTATKPYMHNGLFPLAGVLNMYNAGMPTLRPQPGSEEDPRFPTKSPLLRPLGLNKQDLEDLAAFLATLEEPRLRLRPSVPE
jgi:cytochrome c peroxidase